jgi:hypothetical protein
MIDIEPLFKGQLIYNHFFFNNYRRIDQNIDLKNYLI